MTKKLSSSVALGWPMSEPDQTATVIAVQEAQRGMRGVEIRIGVGPIELGGVPARVVGHAACIASVLKTDLQALISKKTEVRIVIFSSAPKTGIKDVFANLQGIAALGVALRLSGIAEPIQLELAAEESEIPSELDPNLPIELTQWIESAAKNSGNRTSPIYYAREHASASMFGDIQVKEAETPLRITIGCVPEARFWAVRTRVREVALASGLSVAPAIAIIIKACRTPWYKRTSNEPVLAALCAPENAVRLLKDAANPAIGGNAGLTRESRALAGLSKHAAIPNLVSAIEKINDGVVDIGGATLTMGPRLISEISRRLS